MLDRVGATLLDDLEAGPIRAVGMGLAPLLDDGLAEVLSREVDLEELSAPVPSRRFRGRASAS